MTEPCIFSYTLSYSRRVTVVIRFLRKRWYTISGVITYSVRSSRSYTRRISPLSAVLYGAYKPCPVHGWKMASNGRIWLVDAAPCCVPCGLHPVGYVIRAPWRNFVAFSV